MRSIGVRGAVVCVGWRECGAVVVLCVRSIVVRGAEEVECVGWRERGAVVVLCVRSIGVRGAEEVECVGWRERGADEVVFEYSGCC